MSVITYTTVRNILLKGNEIALIDVREEALFATGHPLFAANFPLSRLETEVFTRLPNRFVTIVVYDNGEGLANIAANRLQLLGYTNVGLLSGGLQGWKDAGGEIFIDVNSPSKAFGELVEAKRHTPSLSAKEVKTLIDNQSDVVILDARRFEEYHTMSIPSGISVPGAELVLRVKDIAPKPETIVIVNCAGRTRSIIGAQSLINAGINNRVYALRNGTIGWALAGQALEHKQIRKYDTTGSTDKAVTRQLAVTLANKAGVKQIDKDSLLQLWQDKRRTLYLFDVRSSGEYLSGHLPGAVSAPGGQLTQETDHYAPVRGAVIVLYDNDGVRANMTASWLMQMNWDVYVLKTSQNDLTEAGPYQTHLPDFPELDADDIISAENLHGWIGEKRSITIIDLATANTYLHHHIPGAWYVLRSDAANAVKALPETELYIITSPDGIQARFAAPEFKLLINERVYILKGGTDAWVNHTYPTESGEKESRFASPQTDRYRRPYEGVNNTPEAMQAYLDWEYGLVAQLERDGTHGFFVI